jgi:hypothetical protein
VSLFVNLIKAQKRFLKEEIHPGFRTKTEDLIPKLPNKAKSEQVKAMFKNAGITENEISHYDLKNILASPIVSKRDITSKLGIEPEKKFDAVVVQNNKDGSYYVWGFNDKKLISSKSVSVEELESLIGKKLAQKAILDLQDRQIVSYADGDIQESYGLFFCGVNEDDLSAWHGTANVDPYEKFDYNKVGGPGGEGAQAFGYGLYFTGKKAIAKWYRDKLSSVKSELFIDGKKASFHDNDPINMLIARAWTAIGKELGKNKKTLTKELKHNKSSAFKQWKQRFDQAIAKVQTDSVVIKTDMGKIYHVDIPEDNEYLDWDKPFSEQNPHVKLALETLFKKYKFEKFLDAVKKVDGGNSKALKEIGFSSFDYPNAAGSLYNKLAEVLSERGIDKSQKQVSDELKSLGVPGIKYPANATGGVRLSKDDIYNYVIFDDSKIKIKKVHEWWQL